MFHPQIPLLSLIILVIVCFKCTNDPILFLPVHCDNSPLLHAPVTDILKNLWLSGNWKLWQESATLAASPTPRSWELSTKQRHFYFAVDALPNAQVNTIFLKGFHSPHRHWHGASTDRQLQESGPKHSTLCWQKWDPTVTSCSQNYNDSITLRKAMSSTSRTAGATEEMMGGRDDSQPRKKNFVIPLYIFRWQWLSQLSGSPRNHWVYSITCAGAYEWLKASNQGPLISRQQDCCCLFQSLYRYT